MLCDMSILKNRIDDSIKLLQSNNAKAIAEEHKQKSSEFFNWIMKNTETFKT